MDKIKFIVLIYFIFILSIYGERIYLKDGTIIDGEIFQQTMTTIQVRTYKGELRTINKDDIRRIDFRFDIREEERRKQEEQRRLEEERRKQEEQLRLEEERRKQEEQRRLEEERRKQEEQRRLEEERRKQEEQRLLKKINLFKFEHFLINQSIVSSGYYDIFPLSPYFPAFYEQFSSAPRAIPSRKEKWNYGNFRFSIDLAFEYNRFLWVTYIPIISFFNITYKENLSLPNYSTVFSEANFVENNPITGYFDPRILMGYRLIVDKNNSWNIYLGGEYYRIGINLVKNDCKETVLYSQKLLYLNCKTFDINFDGSGPLFVAEYERWFKYLTFKVQFGLRQLSGNFLYNRDIDNNYDFTFSYRIKRFYYLEGYFYSFHLDFGGIFIEYIYKNLNLRWREIPDYEIFISSQVQGTSYIKNDFRINIDQTNPLLGIDLNYADLFNSKKNFEDLGIISLGFKGRY